MAVACHITATRIYLGEDDMKDRLLTVKESAEYIGRSEAAVRWLIHQNKFAKTAIVGGRRVTRESDLQAWVNAAFDDTQTGQAVA